MKLIKVLVRYINKEGVEKKTYNFYLEFDNGQRVQVKNVFSNDYVKLSFVAETNEK